MPPDERRSVGKALREAVPREAHGHRRAPKGRRDIVDLLAESNEGRAELRAPPRSHREHMANYASMHALEVCYDAIDIDRFMEALSRSRGPALLRWIKARSTVIG